MPRRKEVEDWLGRYDNPMKDVVGRIRQIILDADPRIDECIKWQAPTFAYKGNLASFYPRSKQHASLMFHVGAQIPGRHPRLEGTGETSRVMKLGSVAEATAARRDLERLVRAWCDWRDSFEARKTTAKSKPVQRTKAAPRPKAKATTKSKVGPKAKAKRRA